MPEEKINPKPKPVQSQTGPKPVQPQTGSKPVPGLKPPPARRPILPTSHPVKRQKTRQSKRTCLRTCCCATCLILLVLVTLVAITGCVLYLLVEPRAPVFHLRSVRFVRFNVSDGLDGAVLDSEARVRVEVRNRNRVLEVDYGRTRVELGVDGDDGDDYDVEFGNAGLASFHQPKKNTTVLKFTAKVKGQLLESGLGKKVRDGYKSKKLKIGSEINTEVGFSAKGWNTLKLPIKAVCKGVSIKDLESGSSVPKCKITLFKIFNIKS